MSEKEFLSEVASESEEESEVQSSGYIPENTVTTEDTNNSSYNIPEKEVKELQLQYVFEEIINRRILRSGRRIVKQFLEESREVPGKLEETLEVLNNFSREGEKDCIEKVLNVTGTNPLWQAIVNDIKADDINDSTFLNIEEESGSNLGLGENSFSYEHFNRSLKNTFNTVEQALVIENFIRERRLGESIKKTFIMAENDLPINEIMPNDNNEIKAMQDLKLQDVLKYIPHFEGDKRSKTVYKDLRKFTAACALIERTMLEADKETILVWLQFKLGVDAQEIIADKNYDTIGELIAILQEEYTPRRWLEDIQMDLKDAKQEEDETVKEFVERVGKLLKLCDEGAEEKFGPGNATKLNEGMAVKSLKFGLKNTKMRDQMTINEDRTFKGVSAYAIKLEAAFAERSKHEHKNGKNYVGADKQNEDIFREETNKLLKKLLNEREEKKIRFNQQTEIKNEDRESLSERSSARELADIKAKMTETYKNHAETQKLLQLLVQKVGNMGINEEQVAPQNESYQQQNNYRPGFPNAGRNYNTGYRYNNGNWNSANHVGPRNYQNYNGNGFHNINTKNNHEFPNNIGANMTIGSNEYASQQANFCQNQNDNGKYNNQYNKEIVVKCAKCNRMGHTAADCIERMSNPYCRRCRKYGHNQEGCQEHVEVEHRVNMISEVTENSVRCEVCQGNHKETKCEKLLNILKKMSVRKEERGGTTHKVFCLRKSVIPFFMYIIYFSLF